MSFAARPASMSSYGLPRNSPGSSRIQKATSKENEIIFVAPWEGGEVRARPHPTARHRGRAPKGHGGRHVLSSLAIHRTTAFCRDRNRSSVRVVDGGRSLAVGP